MNNLLIILAVLVAMACFGRAAWLRAQPKQDDGCWLKLPGHIRANDRAWWAAKRRRRKP